VPAPDRGGGAAGHILRRSGRGGHLAPRTARPGRRPVDHRPRRAL